MPNRTIGRTARLTAKTSKPNCRPSRIARPVGNSRTWQNRLNSGEPREQRVVFPVGNPKGKPINPPARPVYDMGTVRLGCTVAADLSLETETADLTVYVNDEVFARITGSATATTNDVRIVHADGTALSQVERAAVADLFQLPDDIFDALDHLISPAENLMGA